MSNLFPYLSAKADVVPVVSKAGEYKLNCIFCGDTKNRMFFNSNTDTVICFNCGFKGNYVTLIAEYEGISTKEAYKRTVLSFEDVGKLIKKETVAHSSTEIKNLNSLYNQYDQITHNSREYDYLIGRGLRYEDILQFGLRKGKAIDGVKNTMQDRVIVPVFEDGGCVYFQGRDITGESSLKTLNPTLQGVELNGKSNYVFNLDKCVRDKPVIITEGPFDAINVKENAVAIFGKSISKKQFSKIISFRPIKVIVMLDRDAHKETLATAEMFSEYIATEYVLLEKYKDPGDIPREEVAEILNSAVLYDDFTKLGRAVL